MVFGDGALGFDGRIDLATSTTASSLAADDVDGDGAIDLVVANPYPNTVSVFRGHLDRTFAARLDFGTADGPASVAIIFFLFEVVLIATLQAFIFATLTAIYLGGAVAEHH